MALHHALRSKPRWSKPGIKLGAVVATLVLGAGVLIATPAFAGDGGNGPDPMVWVCKVVGGPGNYTLKAGKQPIHVSANALDGDVNPVVGAPFSDAQPSFVVASDDVNLCLAGLPPVTQIANPTQPTASAGTAICVDGVSTGTNGSITLPPFEHGHWAEGSGTLNDVPPGEYAFTAVVDDGWTLAPHEGGNTWVVTVPQSTSIDCSSPPTEVTPTLQFTPGTCQATGSVNAVETDAYSWTITGSASAKTYTAVAKTGYTLVGQTVFGPYDLSQIAYTDSTCLPTFTVVESCGYVKITYHNNSQWPRWPDTRFTGDGVTGVDYGSGLTYSTHKVLAGTSAVIFEKTFSEDENGGSVDVWYQDILGAERDIDTSAVKLVVTTDCQVNLTTASAVFTNHTCNAVGQVTLTGTHGTWTIVNDHDSAAGPAGTTSTGIPSGTYDARFNGQDPTSPAYYGGSVMTFVPDEGYSLGEAQSEWSFNATKPANCDTTPPKLAYTGAADATVPLGFGLLALLTGIALVGTATMVGRRKATK